LSCLLKTGKMPTHIKQPSAFKVFSSLVLTFFIITFSTPKKPLKPVTTLSHIISSLSFLNARSWSIFAARSSSLLWIRYTFLANFVRNMASWTAVSPPPTATTIFSLKKAASQVAHEETPFPINFSSPTPRLLGDAPEAMIRLLAVIFVSFKTISFTSFERLREWTSAVSISSPSFSAWFFIFSARSNPEMPSKPG